MNKRQTADEAARRFAGQEDPLAVLGLTQEADGQEIRSRYLQLIKQFPPEREPVRFQEIQQAYRLARDPHFRARRMVEPPEDAIPWDKAVEPMAEKRPRLSTELLLSLGNRD